MKILKKLTALIGGFLFVSSLTLTQAKADNWEALNQAIIAAEKRFYVASETLKNANGELYNIFISYPWTSHFYEAERLLRTRYSEEYSEYIKAKAQLDELLELKNMAAFNEI